MRIERKGEGKYEGKDEKGKRRREQIETRKE